MKKRTLTLLGTGLAASLMSAAPFALADDAADTTSSDVVMSPVQEATPAQPSTTDTQSGDTTTSATDDSDTSHKGGAMSCGKGGSGSCG